MDDGGMFASLIAAATLSGFVSFAFGRSRPQKPVALSNPALDAANERVRQLEKQIGDMMAATVYWEHADHLVVLDGPPAAGKSALVAKWANPTISLETALMKKTAGLAEVYQDVAREPYSQGGLQREKRHRLRYWDIPGEHPETIVSAFDDQKPEFLIFVIDPRQWETSIDRFGQERITFLYARRDIKSSLRGCLLYISKRDLYDEGQAAMIEEKVTSAVCPRFQKIGLEPRVVFGSAASNVCLSDAFGHIVDCLGLTQLLPMHQSVLKA